ncbi:MAG: hypothetical protein Kapaf2KO_12810 [Candidatus Kapaibacteriales bacterium]
MKKLSSIVSTIIITFIIASCGGDYERIDPSGTQVNFDKSLAGISQIFILDGFEVRIEPSSSNSIDATMDESYKNYIEFQENGDMVTIRKKGKVQFADESLIEIIIYKDMLTKVELSGGSKVLDSKINADDFILNISGGSEIESFLNCRNLSLVMSGGSEGILKGKGESLSLDISGGSDLDMEEMEFFNGTITASGGAEAHVSVRDSLTADASGGAEVKYEGEPNSLSVSTSGGGKVERD